jgi:cell division protein FtsB
MKRNNILGIIGLLLVVYLGFLVFQVVQKNYQLNKQINSLSNQISQLENLKDELSYQVQYYKTDSFKEKEARAKFGLMAPGEGVIILPKQQSAPGVNTSAAAKKKVSNPRQWWQFLFG